MTSATASKVDTNNDGSTEQKMLTMLQTQSYNVAMIAPLEEYIVLMCRGTVPYMFHAVRTLIKLYTLFPYSPQGVAESGSSSKNKILDNMGLCCLLALTYGSSSNNQQDIIALRYMIPMTFIPKDNVHLLSQVLHCATLYDNSLFTEFWSSYRSSLMPESTIKSGLPITDLDVMIRNVAATAIPVLQTSILMILSITYQQAPTEIVFPALNISTVEEWKEVMQRNLTIVVDDDDDNATIVHFVPTAHNTQRHRSYQESIHYATTIANLRQ
jgi:hypothetical protein